MWPPAAAKCKALRPLCIGGHITTKLTNGDGVGLVLDIQDACITVKQWTRGLCRKAQDNDYKAQNGRHNIQYLLCVVE